MESASKTKTRGGKKRAVAAVEISPEDSVHLGTVDLGDDQDFGSEAQFEKRPRMDSPGAPPDLGLPSASLELASFQPPSLDQAIYQPPPPVKADSPPPPSSPTRSISLSPEPPTQQLPPLKIKMAKSGPRSKTKGKAGGAKAPRKSGGGKKAKSNQPSTTDISERTDENNDEVQSTTSDRSAHTPAVTPPPPILTPEQPPSEPSNAPTSTTKPAAKKGKKKKRVIINEPIDISAVEDTPERETTANQASGGGDYNEDEEEEEEKKVDTAAIDFQIASTSKEFELHTSSGRRTRRIRDPFYQDQDFSDIEDPVDNSDDDADFNPSSGLISSRKKQSYDGEEEEEAEPKPRKPRGGGGAAKKRGGGRGRGGGAAGRGKGKGKQTAAAAADDDAVEITSSTPATKAKGRPSKGGPPKSGLPKGPPAKKLEDVPIDPDAVFSCVHCEAADFHGEDMIEHMLKKHHSEWTPACPEGELNIMAVFHRFKDIQCLKCDKSYTVYGSFMYHYARCGNEDDMVQCTRCDARLLPSLMQKHEQKHDNEEKMQANQTALDTATPTTGGRTKRQAAARALTHLQEISETERQMKADERPPPPPPEEIEKYTVPKRKTIPKHIAEQLKTMVAAGPAQCVFEGCDEIYSSFRTLKAHWLTCAFGPFDDNSGFNCVKCGEMFITEEQVQTHVDTHDWTVEAKVDVSDSGDEEYENLTRGSETTDETGTSYTGSEYTAGPQGKSGAGGGGAKGKRKPRLDAEFIARTAQTPYVSADTYAAIYDRYGGVSQKLFDDGYTLTEEWLERHTSGVTGGEEDYAVFPHWRPTKTTWNKRLKVSDHKHYLPTCEQSPYFTVMNGKVKKEAPHKNLRCFDATPEKDGFIFNAGGPIWSAGWCPVPMNTTENQYLLLSCHRDHDELFPLIESKAGRSLLQLWNCGKLSCVGAEEEQITPSLRYCLSLDVGAIWAICWCPSGAWDLPDILPENPKVMPRLGLVAVASSAGYVSVISLAHPSSLDLQSPVPVAQRTQNIFPAEVVAKLKPKYQGACDSNCLCVDWLPVEGHTEIIAGFGDGYVCVWELSTQSPLLVFPPTGKGSASTYLPYLSYQAHLGPVHDIAFSHQVPHFAATVSWDRTEKMWDLNNTHTPLSRNRQSIFRRIVWPKHWPMVYAGGEDCYNFDHNAVLGCDNGYFEEKTRPLTVHNSTILGLDHSDWLNTVASGDTTGLLMLCYLPAMIGVNLKNLRKGQRKTVYSTSVEEFSADNQNPSNPNSKNGNKNSKNGEKQNGKTQSCKELFKTHYLVYQDEAVSNFVPNKNGVAMAKFLPRQRYDIPPISAIHQVHWNPNLSSHIWLMSGGQAGLVRLQRIPGLLSKIGKNFIKEKLRTVEDEDE